MKGINTNPGGQDGYTARKGASHSPSLVVSLAGQFQGPCVFTVVCLPPIPHPQTIQCFALLCSSPGQAGRRMDIP